MWVRLNKLIKPNGAIVLFGSEPFSSALRMSNVKNYKYDWIWEKNMNTGLMLAKRQPLRKFENILVFYKEQCLYNRQMIKRTLEEFKSRYRKNDSNTKNTSKHFDCNVIQRKRATKERQMYKPPINILKFNIDRKRNGKSHPTQKPVDLMEYLIKTYTNENDTVLDFTMGSGTTMVAARDLNRNGIGIELDKKYFYMARKRIKQPRQLSFFKGNLN